MNLQQGFSLPEVLISLLLLASTALVLLQQQWQMQQVFHQIRVRSMALNWLDNSSERLLARLPIACLEKPFTIKQSKLNQAIQLQISWDVQSSLQRQLLIES